MFAYDTLEEAVERQTRCQNCGRPKLTLQMVLHDGEVWYELVPCDVYNCHVHCYTTGRCKRRPR